MRRAALLLLVVLAAGCGGSPGRAPRAVAERSCAPTPGVHESVPPARAGTPSAVRLGPGMELEATKRNVAAGRTGDALVLSGTARGEDCGALAGATINVWQTNSKGRYGPLVDGHDRCCYLQATVLTGDDGRFRLETVVPKGYAGGPPHIHLTAGHPETDGLLTELQLGSATTPDTVTIPLSEIRDGSAELDIVLRRS